MQQGPRPRRIRPGLALALAATFLFLPPDTARAGDDNPGFLDVVEHRLDNGMTVLLVPRHDTATVATYLQFHVGGVDDPKGQTGIAHLLEHMMFKGTDTFGTTDIEAEQPLMEKLDRLHAERDRLLEKARSPFHEVDEAQIEALEAEIARTTGEQKPHIVKNELWQAYQRLGGTGLNASTGNDTTQYYVRLPANQLAVWAHLESDRLLNPVFREFHSERDVVHEERRLRTDNEPRGLFGEMFNSVAYTAHPYRNPVVGWSSDIDATVHGEVLAYFRSYYAPNNCVCVLVGDVEPKETIALLERTFGRIPSQPPPRRNISVEPEQKGQRRFVMKLEAAPQLQIGFRAPAAGHPDAAALTVAARVLSGSGGGFGGRGRGGRGGGGGGGTGRLFRSLVLDQEVALNARSSFRPSQYPGLFAVSGTPSPQAGLEALEGAIMQELARLATEPPTDEELARVRNAEDASFIRGLRSDMGLAGSLASAQTLTGDWHNLQREREAIKKVTAADVSRVAREYFVTEHSTVGWLEGTQERSFGGRMR